eukprot:scaffold13838_cov104-Skeletonema_dohrnii-CCMP3373.AAC.6
MAPPLMVGPQQMMYDEKKDDDDVDDHCHDCGSLWPAAAHPAIADSSSTTIVAPRRSRKRRKSVILLFAIVVSILLVTYTQTTYLNETYEQIKFQIRFSIIVARSIYNVVSVNRRKRAGLKVEATARALQTSSSSSSSSHSSSIEDSSKRRTSTTWPDPPLDLFQNSTKLIWAYWHSGEENLTPLCQVSLQSWKAHHPSWQIIILSDATYHHYVPSHHIPSTFHHLKVQFRSDIVRLSVLARYGGAYLDMTTMMFQSLDGIWESELRRVRERGGRNRIFVPTVLELGERPIEEEDSVDDGDDDALLIAATTDYCNQQHDEQQQQPPSSSSHQQSSSSSSNAVGLVTNSVILSPQPNNPILLKFLERILLYSENPASTAQELKIRPEFQRVLPYMTNQRKLGILGKDGTLLYSAHLWIFTDLVLFDGDMEAGKYFVDLPALRWTYDFIILPHTLTKFDAANAAGGGGGACDSMSKTESSSSSSCSSQAATTTAPSTSLQDQLQNERIHSWGTWHILKRAILGMITWQEFDDPNLTNYFVRDVVMFKTSTDGGTLQTQRTYEEFMTMKNSLGRLYRMAMEGTGKNATLEGARPFGYGAEEACSFEFEVC